MAAPATCICVGGRRIRGGGGPTPAPSPRPPCRSPLLVLLVSTLLLLLLLLPEEAQGATAGGHDAPNAAERGMGVFAPGGPWERIRSWAKLTFLNLRSPDSGRAGMGMEEAAVRSLEAGKATAEGAAVTAATVMGAAVEKTKEKVKSSVSSDSGEDAAEL